MEKQRSSLSTNRSRESPGSAEAEEIDDDRPFPHLSSFTRQDRMKKAAYYLLESQNASQEQWQFFETWLKFVFDEAVHVAPGGGAQLRVPSDLESFELSIKASKELMLRLANRFLQACKVPDLRMMSQLSQLQHEIPVSEISLWCRIKRMGKPEQAVDAGFHLDHPVEWLLADLVLPKCEDHASLRNNAMSNRLVPQSYGASLFPVEPESSLSFAMATGSFKSSLLSALFIFKAMGFAKPSDPSLTAITHVEAASCDLLACLGPRGLTRMGLRFNQPTPNGWIELAQHAKRGLDLHEMQDHVETVEYELDDHAHFLEYAAEKRGYTVTLGFVL
ncbi:Beta-carotene isomerase D27 [Durusdinium trenchii]|uniref:Chloroplastic n=1 Tax=Durusdinium trenchii TaxID=1381693 RepID=A0ABP0SMN6_9DINO